MRTELGALIKVDPRSVFAGEKAPLTAWLADNIVHVGATLGMDLELVQRDGAAGGIPADVVARDIARDRIVIVDNSLDSTDDSHLGKIITAASGQDARVIVWVSPEFRDSHRQALEWLNRRGGAVEFYAIGFDLFRIDDSKPGIVLRLEAGPKGRVGVSAAPEKSALADEIQTEAPNRIAAEPIRNGSANTGAGASASPHGAAGRPAVDNAPGSTNGHAAADTGTNGNGYDNSAPSRDHQESYRKFFQRLVDELREKHRFTNAKLGQPQNWYSFASGTSGLVYSIWFSTGGRVRAELYIDVGNRELNRAIFDRLRQQAGEVEKEFGGKLEWDASDSRRACGIGTHAAGKIDDSSEALDSLLKWSIDRLIRLKAVLGPRLPGAMRSAQQAEAR